MQSNKRRRPKPDYKPKETVARPLKSAVPISSQAKSVAPEQLFFAYSFAGGGQVLVPTVDIKLLPPDKKAMITVKAYRGPTTIEQRWAVKDGENKFENFLIEAGDKLEVWCDKPINEVWVSFLFREA